MMMRRYTVPLLAAAVISHAAAQTPAEPASRRTVTVRGSGTVMTPPDQVRILVQVHTRGESATAAMTEAGKRTAAIVALARGYGVEERGIQTARVTVGAIYDHEKRTQPPPIVGYTGTNEFSLLFRGKAMEKAGEFLDRAVGAGASSFGGLLYESSRQREIEREALGRAAADAKARAAALAGELGATLGAVQAITETLNGPVPVQRTAMLDAVSAAPIQAGELGITAQVQVSFELK